MTLSVQQLACTRGLCFSALALLAILSPCAKLSATEFAKPDKGYSLQVDPEWKPISTKRSEDFAFECDKIVCGPGLRFYIYSQLVPGARSISREAFFVSAPRPSLADVSRKFLGGDVRILSLIEFQPASFGRNQFYAGEVLFEFSDLIEKSGDQARRLAYFAVTLDRGFMYVFIFFSASEDAVANKSRFERVLTTFATTEQ